MAKKTYVVTVEKTTTHSAVVEVQAENGDEAGTLAVNKAEKEAVDWTETTVSGPMLVGASIKA